MAQQVGSTSGPAPANDPLHEMGMPVMQRKEDTFWVEVTRTCVDSRRQWRHAGNIRHNSMVSSVLQTPTFRRGVKTQPGG